jgi:hypothetical protein
MEYPYHIGLIQTPNLEKEIMIQQLKIMKTWFSWQSWGHGFQVRKTWVFIAPCLALWWKQIDSHWPTCLFLCQYHAVFAVMTLYYSLKAEIVITSALLFLLRIGVLFVFIWILWFFNLSVKNAIEILMGIALNFYITLCCMAILTIFILLIHEHKRSFRLLVSPTISSLIYSFHCRGL